jgi:hypothetical protein
MSVVGRRLQESSVRVDHFSNYSTLYLGRIGQYPDIEWNQVELGSR